MVEGAHCRFGREEGSNWLVELSRVDGVATLSKRGEISGSGEGQEAISGSGAGLQSSIHSTIAA